MTDDASIKKPRRGRAIFPQIATPPERRSELRDLEHLVGPREEARRREGKPRPWGERSEDADERDD